MAILKERDQKQLYSRAAAGEVKNVIGIDLEPEYPRSPDMVVINDGLTSPQAIADRIKKEFVDTLPDINTTMLNKTKKP